MVGACLHFHIIICQNERGRGEKCRCEIANGTAKRDALFRKNLGRLLEKGLNMNSAFLKRAFEGMSKYFRAVERPLSKD
jgi:hypothetical protein